MGVITLQKPLPPAAPPPNWRSVAPRSEATTRLARGASIALPLSAAAASAVLLSRHPARRSSWAGLGLAVGALVARWQFGRTFNWQPRYVVDFELGRLEVRRYAPQLRAQTTIANTPWRETLSEGFRRLASYIFGANERERRIPMTSPVLVSMPARSPLRRNGASSRPAVAELAQLDGPATREMAFVMPGDWLPEELPAPKDERIRLHSVPTRRVAALAFKGRYGGDLPAQKRNELLFLLKCAGLEPTSEVWFAGYDGPSTLPFLRRNEVLVEVAE